MAEAVLQSLWSRVWSLVRLNANVKTVRGTGCNIRLDWPQIPFYYANLACRLQCRARIFEIRSQSKMVPSDVHMLHGSQLRCVAGVVYG